MLVRWIRGLGRPALFWAAVAGLAFVILGISLFESYESSHNYWLKLGSLATSELGFALWIAVILFITLEEQATREHSKTVLGYLYGIDPGREYFKKIEKYIITQPYFRHSTIVSYYFRERDDESILIDYAIEYVIKNVSRERKRLKIKGSIDKKPLHPASSKWDAGLGVQKIERGAKTFERQDLTIKAGRKASHCEFYETGSITLAPGKELHVKAVHCLVKHDHDSEVWQAAIPCSGVEFRLDWDEKLDLEFATEAIHPEFRRMKRKEPSSTAIRLHLSQPFMAHHGIHFWWAPKDRATGQSTAEALVPAEPPAG